MSSADTIERAFQLAISGRFRDVSSLTKALSKEGFLGAELHLAGPSIRKQLRTLITRAASEE